MGTPIFDLDFAAGDTPEGVDAGGRPPAGEYLCEVSDAYSDHKEETTMVVVYTVLEGLVGGKPTNGFNGQKVYDRLRHPVAFEDQQKAQFAANRMKMMAGRLGVWDGTTGTVSLDFTKAIGRQMCVTLTERKGDKGTFIDVAYDGACPLDHRKCNPRWATKPAGAEQQQDGRDLAASSAVPGASAAPAPARAPAGVDYSDL